VTEKQHGTADVTLVALVSNFYGEGADHLLERFARQARINGTLVIVGIEGEEAPDPADPEEATWTRVRLRYRHTAKNRGNHEWDAPPVLREGALRRGGGRRLRARRAERLAAGLAPTDLGRRRLRAPASWCF
jgi:hypothetical protein